MMKSLTKRKRIEEEIHDIGHNDSTKKTKEHMDCISIVQHLREAYNTAA